MSRYGWTVSVVDLEVTGVDALTDEIVELAAILVNSSGVIESELSLLANVNQRLPNLVQKTVIGLIDVNACDRWQDAAMDLFMAFLGRRPVSYTSHQLTSRSFRWRSSGIRDHLPMQPIASKTLHL